MLLSIDVAEARGSVRVALLRAGQCCRKRSSDGWEAEFSAFSEMLSMQDMLANSFSFLPVNAGSEGAPEWRLISDCALAAFLRSPHEPARPTRLGLTLREAVGAHDLRLHRPYLCRINESAQAALEHCGGLPVLIVSEDSKQLLGLATAFDLL